MKKIVALTLACLIAIPALAGLDKNRVAYVGGTLASIPEKAEGPLDTATDTQLVFSWLKGDNSAYPAGSISIPYAKITSLEYGQKAGRRVGVAILVSPIALFSKKRKHFLTIGFTRPTEVEKREKGPDGTEIVTRVMEDKPEAIVLELGKAIVKTTLTILEVRSGQKIEYESEDAKKHVNG